MSERKRSRVWYRVGGCLVALVLGGVGLYVGLWLLVMLLFGGTTTFGPGGSTQTGYVTQLRNGQVEFDLTYGRKTTGIVQFVVSDPDGTLLWELSGGGTGKPTPVVYGKVPPGWTQVYPFDGGPPPDIRGRRVHVRIDTRFQVEFGPGVEVNEGDVDVPAK